MVTQYMPLKPDSAGHVVSVITPGMIGSPFDRQPMPRHNCCEQGTAHHVGYADGCALCAELQAYVARITGVGRW